MWIFATTALIVLAILFLLYGLIDDDFFGGACIICPLLLFAAVGVYKSNTYTIEPKPTALDVYQGNTILEITSINGVPTDTVVVFKNK